MWRMILWFLIILIYAVDGSLSKKDEENKDFFLLHDIQNDGSGSGGTPTEDYSSGNLGGDDEDGDGLGYGVTPSERGGAQLSLCQQMRLVSGRHSVGSHVPQCTADGLFARRQCREEETCWCVDRNGLEIPNTVKFIQGADSEKPDCTGGSNLSPCVIHLVNYHWDGLQSKPDCTKDGHYRSRQCHDGRCWCVDSFGRQIPNSSRTMSAHVDCGGGDVGALVTPSKSSDPDSDIIVEEDNSVGGDNRDGKDRGDLDSVDIDEGTGEDRSNGIDDERDNDSDDNGGNDSYRLGNVKGDRPQAERYVPLTEQPGILAGIIAGALVGLLCIVLLIIFVVCRMRTSDEGSYTLNDATKARGSYAYQKAPEKEFYA